MPSLHLYLNPVFGYKNKNHHHKNKKNYKEYLY